ncbi:MAG: GIY-YIG nuclease family protein [Pseudomonadota bacterium]
MDIQLTVYILECADGRFYTGSTKKPIEARVWEHNHGAEDSYCARRRPVNLVFTEVYARLLEGHARERQIKGWSRKKKIALIKRHYEALPNLSRRRVEDAD